MNIKLEFDGFYCSHLDDAIDYAFQSACENYVLNVENEDANDVTYDDLVIDHAQIRKDTGQLIVDTINREFKKPIMVFNGIDSPREYNFGTDRLDVTLSDEFMIALKGYLKNGNEHLVKHIKDHCTSRSGFSSFYSNDIKDWQETELEPAQISLLASSFLEEMMEIDLFNYEYLDSAGILSEANCIADYHIELPDNAVITP